MGLKNQTKQLKRRHMLKLILFIGTMYCQKKFLAPFLFLHRQQSSFYKQAADFSRLKT